MHSGREVEDCYIESAFVPIMYHSKRPGQVYEQGVILLCSVVRCNETSRDLKDVLTRLTQKVECRYCSLPERYRKCIVRIPNSCPLVRADSLEERPGMTELASDSGRGLHQYIGPTA